MYFTVPITYKRFIIHDKIQDGILSYNFICYIYKVDIMICNFVHMCILVLQKRFPHCTTYEIINRIMSRISSWIMNHLNWTVKLFWENFAYIYFNNVRENLIINNRLHKQVWLLSCINDKNIALRRLCVRA